MLEMHIWSRGREDFLEEGMATHSSIPAWRIPWTEEAGSLQSTESQRTGHDTLATSCKELTHWKRPWCWEGLGAGGEGDDRGWDGWMASLTRWTWVWVNSGCWWWTGRPGMLQFTGLQRVRHDWVAELNWTESLKSLVGCLWLVVFRFQFHNLWH